MNKSFSSVEIKDATKGTVSAVFSTFNVIDKDGDVTLPGAFTDGQPVVISNFQHTSWDGAPPLGKGVIRVEADETILDGQFFMNTQHGKEAFSTVKQLSDAGLQEWSYSLHNVKSHRGQMDGKDVNFLESIFVKEVSPVMIGAGVNTRTLAIKNGDLKFSEHKEAVLTALSELAKRATEVVTLRAEQHKSFSWANDLHQQIEAEASRLKACIDEHTPTTTNEDEAALQREYLRFVALTQGV